MKHSGYSGNAAVDDITERHEERSFVTHYNFNKILNKNIILLKYAYLHEELKHL